ncbi:hypothetical protein ACTQV8_09230 [Lactobacillus amylovorus]|uniref:hypothetical protein n=1 Tax=Lactobacillus amylovorus TaxID=1604 RepID=UPI003F9BA16C
MEQLVIIINNEKETSIYATAPNVDATGLDQVDFLTVRDKSGKLRRLNHDYISEWWEKDMDDGSLLVREDGSLPTFQREPSEDMKKIFVGMQKDDATGRIQPLREFECSPTLEDIEKNQEALAQAPDPAELQDLIEFDNEMGEPDDFKHSTSYLQEYYICWTNKKDFEAALPKEKKDKDGRATIDPKKINTDCAMFLSPEDFYYLNDKSKIYAYVHKSTEICTPDHTPGYY